MSKLIVSYISNSEIICLEVILSVFVFFRLENLPLSVSSLPLKALWLSQNQVSLKAIFDKRNK